MIKNLLIACTFLSVVEIPAQEHFFTFAGGWGGYAGVETDDGYTILGVSFQDSFQNQLQADELTTEGILVDGYSFHVDTMDATGTTNSAKQLLQVSEDEYLGVGSMNTGPTAYGIVFRHNTELQTSDVVLAIHDASATQFYGIHAFTDTTYLVTGILGGVTLNTRLYCIGYNDSIYWTQDFSWGGLQYLTTPHDMTVTQEGDIVVLFKERDLEGSNQFEDRERTLLVKMTNSGDELWRAYPGNHENFKIRPGGVIESNGEILVCFTDPFYYDSTGEWQGHASNKVRFERFDTEGNSMLVDSITESDYYGPLRIVNQFTELSDNNYLVAGYHNNGMAMLMKVQPDLDLVWNRRYTPYSYSENPFQQSALFHTLETTDGGFLCTGEYNTDPGGINHPNGFQSGFAMKLDGFGCLEEGCHVVGLAENELPNLKVFPNPSSGDFFIDGLEAGEEYSITILNINGQIQQKIEWLGSLESLRIENLDRGFYQVQIRGVDAGFVVRQVVVL